MDTSSESDGEDLPQVIHTAAISPNNVCDRRSVRDKYLAAYLLLGSVLFEQIALYSLTISIKFTLRSNETMGWSSDHSETASLTFFGNSLIIINGLILFTFHRHTIFGYICICCVF